MAVTMVLAVVEGSAGPGGDQATVASDAESVPPAGIEGAERLTAAEQATASRLMQHPDFAGRTFIESAHLGAEYVDDLGRSFDALGNPAASQYWNEREFLSSINTHLLKSNEFTVIDLTGFTSSQVQAVTGYVNSLSANAQARIVRLGF